MSDKNRDFEVVSKYSNETLKKPIRATKHAAGYDIFNNSGFDIIIEPGELSDILTTKYKAFMLPDEALFIYPRSGHGFKYSVRLANTVGIIDSDYYNNPKNEGEIFIRLHNQGTKTLKILRGESFAQGIFAKFLLIDGDSLDNGDVREGGLGSTTGKV